MAFRIPGEPLAIMRDESSGKRLSDAMEAKGVTVSKLSKMTGLSTRCITNLRSGKSEGNMATWRIISRRLGVGMDELVEG